MEPKDDIDIPAATLAPRLSYDINKCRADGKIGVHPVSCEDDPELCEDVCEEGEAKRLAAEKTRAAQ